MARSLPHFNLVAFPRPWLRLRVYSYGYEASPLKCCKRSLKFAQQYILRGFSLLLPKVKALNLGPFQEVNLHAFDMAQPHGLSLTRQRG